MVVCSPKCLPDKFIHGLANFRTLTGLSGISGFGFDLVRGTKTIDLIKSAGFPSGKYLFAGVVDGRNIWANDLAASLSVLSDLESVVGKGTKILMPLGNNYKFPLLAKLYACIAVASEVVFFFF